MKKPYLIIYNDKFSPKRKPVTDYLDTLPEVTYWYACMSHSIFAISTIDAQTLSDKLKKNFGVSPGVYLMVLEIGADRQGWMPKQVWHMIRNLESPRLRSE